MKKILILTTNRADYYKLEPIINVIYNHNDIKMYLIVSGSHLLTDYGNTYKNINYPIYKKINTLINVEDNKFMSESISLGTLKYTTLLEDIKPDYVILHGDRFDILSMANVCLLMNIDIIHIEGGEKSGCIDNKIRNIVSIISKYHIVSNEMAYNNLLSIVNNKNNIYNLGCPIIDKYNSIDYSLDNFNNILKTNNLYLDKYNFIILIFHIDTLNIESSENDFIKIFNTIKKMNITCLLLYPNIDNHTKKIIRYIDNNKTDNMIAFKHLEFNILAVLLKYSSIFIGNSSSIVRESPFLGIQSILIGKRQINRNLSDNTYWLKDMNEVVLENKIKELYNKKYESCNLYGNGSFKKKFKEFINNL